MRKKIFDYKLYFQGLLQLKLIGIIFYVICVVSSALPPIMYWIEKARIAAMHVNPTLPSAVPYNTSTLQVMSSYTSSFSSPSNIILILFAYIAPVIMCISLFSFINKANASDFYHSAPNTRTSIFLSFGASVLSWLYITVISSVAISSIIYACAGVTVGFSSIFYSIFSYLAAVTLVTGGILLAMSITGTILSNIVVTALILFVPRLIITIYTSALSSTLIIANTNEYGWFSNPNLNIPFSLISNIFFHMSLYSYSNATFFVQGIIYTFVLGFIYLGFGALLYKVRNSETALKSAPNKALQHIFRIAITLPVSLIIPCSIVSWKGTGTWVNTNQSTLVTVIIVCLLIYFIYELITTKKAKNLLKAAPLFLIVVVIDIIFGAAMIQTRETVYAFSPAAGEIEYVSFIGGQNQPMYYMNGITQNFNNLQFEKVKFNEKEIINLISSSLSDTIDKVKTNSLYSSDAPTVTQYVNIKTKDGKYVKRLIYFSQTNSALILDIEKDNADYKKAVYDLPTDNEVKSISVVDLSDPNIKFSNEDCQKIWAAFKQDYKQLSLDDAINISGINNYYNNSYVQKPTSSYSSSPAMIFQDSNTMITISGNDGISNFTSNFRVTSAMPKTSKLINDFNR